MSFRDDWPTVEDGSDFDGRNLLSLYRRGESPFRDRWDVGLLAKEIEQNLGAEVIDIPFVYNGSNNYGFHFQLADRSNVLVRLARGDVNMPDYDGFTLDTQVPEIKFEVAAYDLLRSEPSIPASRLLYHRIPERVVSPETTQQPPQHLKGRRLMVFERADGENNLWKSLESEQRNILLVEAANIRAALYNFQLPLDFASEWLRERLFEQKPKTLPLPVTPTRDFCTALLRSKIEATIGEIGDMIGWEDDENVVGPIAAAAKQNLLALIPHIMPEEIGSQPLIYRLVLEHGDFGIHNMSIIMENRGAPSVTSLYDFETGCVVPALLAGTMMAVTVDLVTDEDANPSITRVKKDASPEERSQFMEWSKVYHEALFTRAPDCRQAIRAGRDIRHIWFALQAWRGDDPEEYFGKLGAWAEKRPNEIRSRPSQGSCA